MPLYTVVVGFSDHRQGIEQYEGPTPEDAILAFVESGASFLEYDREAIAGLIDDGRAVELIHVADGIRGLWVWVPSVNRDARTDDILGGFIVQADPKAPIRPTGELSDHSRSESGNGSAVSSRD